MNAMKTNHMTNKIKSLAAAALALALFALGFAGCQQTADGNLPEGSGNLNLIQVDILVGQTVNGLAQSNPAGMVLRVGVHEEEEVLPLTELLIGGSLDKICEMCKLVEQDKADIILTV